MMNKSEFNQNNEENSFCILLTSFSCDSLNSRELLNWRIERTDGLAAAKKLFFQSAFHVVVDAHTHRISVGLCNGIWMCLKWKWRSDVCVHNTIWETSWGGLERRGLEVWELIWGWILKEIFLRKLHWFGIIRWITLTSWCDTRSPEFHSSPSDFDCRYFSNHRTYTTTRISHARDRFPSSRWERILQMFAWAKFPFLH